MSERIRVLIIEDSLFMQQVLQTAIEKHADIELVGAAKSGAEAINMIRTRRPDVATLDILLPDTDGLTLLRQLVALHMPVVIVSNVSLPESAVALQALDQGAIDCIAKPHRTSTSDAATTAAFANELVAKLRGAAAAGGATVKKLAERRPAAAPLKIAKSVVVIGASAGGPLLIREIIPRLPPDLAAGVLVVQHMSGQFTKHFTSNLAGISKIRVKEAQPGDAFVDGTVLVSGGDETVKVEWISDGVGAITFSQIGTTHFGFRVWIDAAMATTSLLYGRRMIGVLLSGMGSDGVEGLRLIRKGGGRTLVQDESTSVVFGMPKAAIEAGVADRVLPIQKIADAIVEEVEALKGVHR